MTRRYKPLDRDIYIQMMEKSKDRFKGFDLEEENIKRINNQMWEGIIKFNE